MKKLGKNMALRGLAIQSLLAMSVAVVLPSIAKIEGKEFEVLSMFPFLFSGLIGIAAYQSIAQLMKRIDELENR